MYSFSIECSSGPNSDSQRQSLPPTTGLNNIGEAIVAQRQAPEHSANAVEEGVFGPDLTGVGQLLGLVCRHGPTVLQRRTVQGANMRLSDRETEVLSWVARGLTDREVAHRLSINFSTARKHRENLLDKLKVGRASALVAIYLCLDPAPTLRPGR